MACQPGRPAAGRRPVDPSPTLCDVRFSRSEPGFYVRRWFTAKRTSGNLLTDWLCRHLAKWTIHPRKQTVGRERDTGIVDNQCRVRYYLLINWHKNRFLFSRQKKKPGKIKIISVDVVGANPLSDSISCWRCEFTLYAKSFSTYSAIFSWDLRTISARFTRARR